MNIVLGATGNVGSAVIDGLIKQGAPVRGIIRNPEKAHMLAEKGAEVGIADGFDLDTLVTAFKGGSAVFLITPESYTSNDIFGDAEILLKNYREAIEKSGIKKVVAISSMGAQLEGETGNLKVSSMLEKALADLDAEVIFVRPAYYFSNWLYYVDTVREHGVLPTFYPVDQKISMCSPADVGEYASRLLVDEKERSQVVQLAGPEALSSADVAAAFGKIYDKQVQPHEIPEGKWGETLEKGGFSIEATNRFIEMTNTVIEGKTQAPDSEVRTVVLTKKMEDYLREALMPTS